MQVFFLNDLESSENLSKLIKNQVQIFLKGFRIKCKPFENDSESSANLSTVAKKWSRKKCVCCNSFHSLTSACKIKQAFGNVPFASIKSWFIAKTMYESIFTVAVFNQRCMFNPLFWSLLALTGGSRRPSLRMKTLCDAQTGVLWSEQWTYVCFIK